MDIKLTIKKTENWESEHLINALKANANFSEISINTKISEVPQPELNAFPSEQIIEIIISISGNIAIGLITNWIYDSLKDKTDSCKINDNEIPLNDKDNLEKVIKDSNKLK